MSLRAATPEKSRGDGLAVVLSVLPAAGRVVPPGAVDCEVEGCEIEGCDLLAVEPPEAPGEGVIDAGIVTGSFAQPLATRISSAAGTIRTLLIVSTLLAFDPDWVGLLAALIQDQLQAGTALALALELLFCLFELGLHPLERGVRVGLLVLQGANLITQPIRRRSPPEESREHAHYCRADPDRDHPRHDSRPPRRLVPPMSSRGVG